MSLFVFLKTASPLSAQVLINECLPNPTGDEKTDEWIELYNAGDTPQNLDGWWLDDVVDGGSNPYSLDGLEIHPQSFLSISIIDSGIQLNNSGAEKVRLYTSDEVKDEISFESIGEGKSFGRVPDGSGLLTTIDQPSKGAANIPPATAPASSSPSPTTVVTVIKKVPLVDISLSEIMACPSEGKEWIEVFNSGEAHRLDGWIFRDAAGNEKVVSFDIGAEAYVSIDISGSFLNNSGDTLIFLNTEYEAADAMSYESCEKGYSFLLESGMWKQTRSVTKGEANVFTPMENKDESSEPAKSAVETSVQTTTLPSPSATELVTQREYDDKREGLVAGISSNSAYYASWSGIIRASSDSATSEATASDITREKSQNKHWFSWFIMGGSVLMAGAGAPLFINSFKEKNEWIEVD